MSTFSWVFQTQSHKTRDGYYINHDNLLLASPEERKRLIFYFIANQVPEKLDPRDRHAFNTRRSEQVTRGELSVTFAALATYLLRVPMYQSRLSNRLFLNLGVHLFGASLVYYFSSSLGHSLFEPRFASQDSLITDLSAKYNFSIFDFAQAKKEAHLKHLRNELLKETRIQINP